MAEKNKTPHNDLSLDEILAEAQTLKDPEPPAPAEAREPGGRQAPASREAIAEAARRALEAETAGPLSPPPAPKNEKKKHAPFWRRGRGIPEFEEEDDIYYGLQLKSLQEYREDYEKTLRIDSKKIRDAQSASAFSYLFEKNAEDSGAEKEDLEAVETLRRERRERVERALRAAGLEHEDIFSITSGPSEPAKSAPAQAEIRASAAIPARPEAPESAAPSAQPEIPEPAVSAPARPEQPVPHPAPVPPPAPRPEILPGPQRGPEIPWPMTEPPVQPSAPPAQPAPQPGPVPEIRCGGGNGESGGEPVREPVPVPPMREETPPPPAVGEPPAKPAPYSCRAGVPAGYRPPAGKPVHMLDLSDFRSILQKESETYSGPAPQPLPEPIPLPGHPPAEAAARPASAQPEKPEPPEAEPPEEQEPIPFPGAPEEPDISAPPPEEEFAPAEDKKGFHVFGSEEEDNDDQEELPGEPEELDDYNSPADAPSVENELLADLRRLSLRFAVTGLCLALLLATAFLGECAGLLPPSVQVELEVQPYLILNFLFLLLASAFCAAPLRNGLWGLFTFQANSDSAAAVADLAAVTQSILLFFAQDGVRSGALHLYSALAVLALFLNTAGKLSMLRRMRKNFRFAAAPEQKQAVQLYDDHNTALQMAQDCVLDTPAIAYQAKTDFLSQFLKLSYEPDPSEQTSQFMAPIGFVCSLAVGIAAFFLSRDMYRAVTAFAAAACVGVPFMNMLSVNLPLNRLCKIAARCGAMLIGYPAVDRFSAANAVLADAKDLFPKGTVVLNGIKTFAGRRIDEAIVDATALMCAAGGPLSDLFDQIIQSRRDMLPKVDNLSYEDGLGVTGWVSGRRILIGARGLMESHGIEPPSRDYEEKYIQGGRQTVYLASGGDLVALFVVSYHSDRRRAMELRRMEDNGISLIVRTRDPNVTPRLLSDCFGLDESCVRILPERLGAVYADLTARPQERAPALLATKGRPTAMMRMLTACVRQRSNISAAVALQNIAVILGILLIAFLTFYSGLKQMSTSALLSYELFWALAIWLIPRLRKP